MKSDETIKFYYFDIPWDPFSAQRRQLSNNSSTTPIFTNADTDRFILSSEQGCKHKNQFKTGNAHFCKETRARNLLDTFSVSSLLLVMYGFLQLCQATTEHTSHMDPVKLSTV